MAKKKTKSKKPAATVPFEQSLSELKEIVGALEAGNLSLGDSLEKYETGIKHLKQCYQALESAEQKIKVLVSLDPDGNLQTSSFDGRPTQFNSVDSGNPARTQKSPPSRTPGPNDVEEELEGQSEDAPEFGEDFYDDTEDIDDTESLF